MSPESETRTEVIKKKSETIIGNLLEWSGCIDLQVLLREYKIEGLAIAFDLSNVNEFTIFFGGANDQGYTLRRLRDFQEFFNKSPDVACRNGLLLKGVEAIDAATPEEFQNKLQARRKKATSTLFVGL